MPRAAPKYSPCTTDYRAAWAFGLPVPLLIAWAPTWGWINAANVLLGVNQGLAWSATVIMKIDLAGPRRRGLAMGLNEFAGYLAVAAAAAGAGYLAARYGPRPAPFWIAEGAAVIGFLLSWLVVRDTSAHARYEERLLVREGAAPIARTSLPPLLAGHSGTAGPVATSQAGLVNNLNDGVA